MINEERDDLYSILECPIDANPEDLRQSYQRLLLRHHPDKNGGEESQEFLRVVAAWRVLGDSSERRRYDARKKNEEDSCAGLQVWETLTYQELEIDEEGRRTHPCRCGGEFQIPRAEEKNGDEFLVDCDTCSLYIRVKEKT